MSGVKRIVQNSLYFLSSNAVNFFLGIFTSIVLARTLKPNNLGIFHQIQWFTGLLSTLLSFGFITCIIKFAAQYNGKKDVKSIGAMVKFVMVTELVITLISCGILVALSAPISDFYFSPKESKLFAIAFLSITPGIQTAILSALLEGLQLFKYQTLHSLTVTPVALLTKVFLLLTGYGLEALMWCNLAFSIINFIYYRWAVYRENRDNGWFPAGAMEGERKKELLQYNRSVFSITIVDLVVWARSENYFLGVYCPAVQVAYYNLAHNLVVKLTGLIPILMWKILLPVASEHHGKNNLDQQARTYYHALRYSAFLLFPLTALAILSAYELMVLFFGWEYAEAKLPFRILLFGAILTSLSQPGSAVIYAANRQRFVFWFGAILSVVNIALGFLIIPRWGATGAASVYAIVTSLGTLGGFYYLLLVLQLRAPWKSMGKIALCCLPMVLVSHSILQIRAEHFDWFPWIYQSFQPGFNLKLLFGPRLVRLVLLGFAGLATYLVFALAWFRPGRDDWTIIQALDRILPAPVISWLKARRRE